MMFYKGDSEDLKNKYQIPNLLGILCYLLMKCFYYMCMFKEKPLKAKQYNIFRLANYFLFIIWNTLLSFSVSLLCNKLEDRAFIVSENLLIYQEIYFFLKLDFKQKQYIKALPVIYSAFISGIVTRSLQNLQEQSQIWSDIILFITNSCFILVVSYMINEEFEKQERKIVENSDSKIQTDIQKDKYDKKADDFDHRSSKIGNINKSKEYYKQGSNGISANKKQSIFEENINNHHEINGQKSQQFKGNGVNQNNSQLDRYQSIITLKNIEADDQEKTFSNTQQLHDTNLNKFNSSNIKPQCQKQMYKNGILGYLKNGNNLPKTSSSFLQQARNFDDQIIKSQNDISFNNTVNKREDVEQTSNNVLLLDYYSANQLTSQNTTQPFNYEAQSQPIIPSTSSNQRKSSLKKKNSISNDITKNQDYIISNRSQTVGNQNDIINHQNKTLLQQIAQTNRFNSLIDNINSPINDAIKQSINNDSNTSFEFQNERTNKRELTAVFQRDEQSPKGIYDSFHKNSQIIEKSSEYIQMSELTNEHEICYNILNNVDFAAFKMDISGSWKIDFHNEAAKQLVINNKKIAKDIAQIFKKISIISLSKESQNTINVLGLMNNNDYKFSPQIKHSNQSQDGFIYMNDYKFSPQIKHAKQSSKQSELNKYARGSINKQDQQAQNGVDNYLSPARKIDISLMKLSANMNTNFSLKQSTQDNSNTQQINSISKTSNLNNNQTNQTSSPSHFKAMSVYQFINNIRNSIKSQSCDISQSVNNSHQAKTASDGCQRILIETFLLEDDVKLFSNEDIIKIFIVKNKYIIVIIENMQQYYNAAKNQVTKTIQNGMLKTISHEIGTHLSILFSILNVCMMDCAISDQTKEEYLTPFQQNMMLIYLLIQDFKDYQDILLDRFSIKLVKSDIKKLLREAVELVQKQAQEKKIQINIKIEDSIQNMIHIDPTRFKQILINLLSNSLKFTGQNKQIDVSMKYSSNEQENIEVIVQDQGIGMDQEEQEALTKLLKDGISENKISLKSSGYGFGLTVSNKIALKLNEEIQYGTGNTPQNKKKNSTTSDKIKGLQFESAPKLKVGSKFWFNINIEKSDLIDQQQQQLMQQSQVSQNNNKKWMQASLMGFGDQFIEIEKNSQYTKMTSLIHDFKNTNQADSVFFDDLHRKVESRVNFQSVNPSPKLSIEHKTSSLKNSRQTNFSLIENNSNQFKNNNYPLSYQTNMFNYQQSFINSSMGQQSPPPLPFRINRVINSNSTFSFNNAGSNQPNRNTNNEMSKGAFESHFKNIDETRSYGQDDQQLERSDHIKPIPSSKIEEKVYDVLRAKKYSDTQNISQEKYDYITSLNHIKSNITEIFNQSKSEIIQSSPDQNPYILIVDDTQSNHNSLILYLEKIYKISKQFILQAYNGQEGFEIVVKYQNQIRLIFMDLNMPILDGKQSTQKIREYERNNDLESFAIVAYTAYSDPSTENECLNQYEFNYFLPKPIVDRSKLTDILEITNIIN